MPNITSSNNQYTSEWSSKFCGVLDCCACANMTCLYFELVNGLRRKPRHVEYSGDPFKEILEQYERDSCGRRP